ncbi:MAG: hypothetical protein ABDH23_05410 [Endomicrobiia bacterium]
MFIEILLKDKKDEEVKELYQLIQKTLIVCERIKLREENNKVIFNL